MDKSKSRYSRDRKKISVNADTTKSYMVTLPLKDVTKFICVNVFPDKKYGDIYGKDLICKYLSRYWKKGNTPHTGAKRQYLFKHKVRYGHRSVADIELLTKLGNELNDVYFRKYIQELNKLTDPETIRKYKAKLTREAKKRSFKFDNELKSWWHGTPEEKRMMEQSKIDESEEDKLLKAMIKAREEDDDEMEEKEDDE